MDKQLDIRILELHWLENMDESLDLCVHGKIYIRIGDEVVCDANKGSWTLGSTVLYLMRTVERNYEIGDFASQLVPCCGHFFIADDDYVIIHGCPSGIDWTIRHIDDNTIKHISGNGIEAIIDKGVYTKMVLAIANKVEGFYQESKPKLLQADKSIIKGYEAFWNEWEILKNKIESNLDASK